MKGSLANELKWLETPLYQYSGVYAIEHNELDLYRDSSRANAACKNAIEKAIRDHFDGYRLNTKAVSSVIEAFGKERVLFLLANTLIQKRYDGRFGNDNISWALSEHIQPDIADGIDKRCYLVVESHPAVLDGFIRHARLF